jgi:hypothetical protein
MILKDIINKSYYGSVGYISNLDDINCLEQYIIYNLPVLKEFINVITSTTYVDNNSELRLQLENTWKKYFPNSVHIDTGISRGHSFGAADNDNTIIDYCKNNNIDWVCKSANDIIIHKSALEQLINNADFYYLNGIGYGGMIKYDFDLDKVFNEDFYPQTNFYIINTSKIDYLNDKQYLNHTYEVTKTPGFNGRIWEYVEGWTCETFLKQCIERNNLSKKHLVSDKNYITLLEIIKQHKIHDPSHKNIMIDGICHLHFPENETIIINNI